MILVTGGAGSIGSEIVRHLVSIGESVRVMDINEEGLWSLKCELPEIDVYLGSVGREVESLSAMDRVSAVIHCAAAKHVDLCECNAAYATAVNIFGTRSMLSRCRRIPLVFISTDKAIRPVSVMGETKLRAERMAIRHDSNVVRFGNVIGTRGSLVPMVQRCAELGRPIPLTDPAMTRWMMSIDEAVVLVMEALRSQERGKVFVPINPAAVNIGRFVELCRDELAPNCEIVRTQIRPGERLHEPMELRDGSIVWSNEVEPLNDAEMLHLIQQAVTA